MNELEPQQNPQEPQPAAETTLAEPAPVPAAEPEAASAEPPPAAEGAPAQAAEAPPVQEAAPAAAPPRQEPKNARAAQKPAAAERAQRRAGGERNGRARPQAQTREAARPERGRGPEGPIEIDLDKLITDSLYLDNQAHAIVARMRDMDSGTRSQLRRLFSAVRRACRTAESERQHAFVMLRARLAYTIARHQLRSLDPLEKLLLQVTRRNDARGYERFRDLFEAIVAYNE
ncbi:MAG: hypothetical protein KatS3mg004_3167 [Bryobacteraceae bacterium]|nr:MAG: hypothetical protein KatS3mg004_3167 [Bryobacteraceae bacterium]